MHTCICTAHSDADKHKVMNHWTLYMDNSVADAILMAVKAQTVIKCGSVSYMHTHICSIQHCMLYQCSYKIKGPYYDD